MQPRELHGSNREAGKTAKKSLGTYPKINHNGHDGKEKKEVRAEHVPPSGCEHRGSSENVQPFHRGGHALRQAEDQGKGTRSRSAG